MKKRKKKGILFSLSYLFTLQPKKKKRVPSAGSFEAIPYTVLSHPAIIMRAPSFHAEMVQQGQPMGKFYYTSAKMGKRLIFSSACKLGGGNEQSATLAVIAKIKTRRS